MQILIVDDESLARARLKRLLTCIEGCEVVGEAVDGVDALDKVEELDPTLVFMDIRMPGKDGLEAARNLAELSDPPAIVFCTAYDEYALEAFTTLAVGYLVKPVQLEDLQGVIAKAQKINKAQKSALSSPEAKNNSKERKHISAKSRKGMELIELDGVYCFVADQKYVTIHHREGETLIDDTLKELESEFSEGFIRVHRNALVSIQQISAMEKTKAGHYELRLKDSDYRPSVSRRHLGGLRDLLNSM
ncbi:MAG: two-component system response regulator AlgR [Flavobacteriales bacterium]|jgi:two-component system response regulator AlgR